MSLAMKAAQPGLNQPNVESIQIVIPQEDVINKFNNIIEPLINRIFLNSIENKKLSKIRDYLLPLLMNGQIIVK